MAAQVDLHLHTTASDGRLTPSQLIELVAGRGLKVIAITDHDSTEGIPEALMAASKHPGLQVIPGIELSADVPRGEVHILGHFMDYKDPELQQTLKRLRVGREGRARAMVEKLKALGMPIEWSKVLELSGGGAIGRPHIALAMIEKGYISGTQEAFSKYIGRNGPAYVERERLTPEEAIKMVLRFRGLPTLAHPRETEGLDAQLPILKRAGLVGMEVFYGSYTPDDVKRLQARAKLFDLLPLGGSDYHALGNPNEVEPGSVGPPLEMAHRLIALASSQYNGKK